MSKPSDFIDVDTMRRNANNYFCHGRNCAQATLLGLCSVVETALGEEEIIALASGLGGGMGSTYAEGTCGALTAGVIFLGLHYNKSARTIEKSRELYNHFKNTYGSPQCAKVIEMARGHECLGCCITVIDKIAEILAKDEAAKAAVAEKSK